MDEWNPLCQISVLNGLFYLLLDLPLLPWYDHINSWAILGLSVAISSRRLNFPPVSSKWRLDIRILDKQWVAYQFSYFQEECKVNDTAPTHPQNEICHETYWLIPSISCQKGKGREALSYIREHGRVKTRSTRSSSGPILKPFSACTRLGSSELWARNWIAK